MHSSLRSCCVQSVVHGWGHSTGRENSVPVASGSHPPSRCTRAEWMKPGPSPAGRVQQKHECFKLCSRRLQITCTSSKVACVCTLNGMNTTDVECLNVVTYGQESHCGQELHASISLAQEEVKTV